MPFLDPSEPALLLPLLNGELLRGLGDMEYRGGVIYWVPGVAEAEEVLGLRPRSPLCVGVRRMSERSSLDVIAGRAAMVML